MAIAIRTVSWGIPPLMLDMLILLFAFFDKKHNKNLIIR